MQRLIFKFYSQPQKDILNSMMKIVKEITLIWFKNGYTVLFDYIYEYLVAISMIIFALPLIFSNRQVLPE